MKSHKNLEKIIRKFDFDFLEHQTWSSKYITFVRLQSIRASKIQTDKRREQKNKCLGDMKITMLIPSYPKLDDFLFILSWYEYTN